MSNRCESRLSSVFYKYIDLVTPDLWLKFARHLGLAESDLQSIWSRKDIGLQERKYQLLTRWKMFIGDLSDHEIDNILSEAQGEVDHGREITYFRYSLSMKNNVNRARNIYKVAEAFETDSWTRIVRDRLSLADSDVRRISHAHSDDQIEMRYQMILRWIRTHGIREGEIDTELGQIINQAIHPQPSIVNESAEH